MSYLLYGMTLGFPAAAQPGPFQAYLLGQVLRQGWYRTLPAAFAPLLSDGPILILTIFILSQTPAWFLAGLRLLGGFFMLYLAYLARPTAPPTTRDTDIDTDNIPPTTAASTQAVFRHAALMNLLNPMPYIFWGTVAGPILITAWRAAPSFALIFLLGFYGTLIGGLALFITVIAVLGRLDPRLNQLLALSSTVLLALLGVYQILLALNLF